VGTRKDQISHRTLMRRIAPAARACYDRQDGSAPGPPVIERLDVPPTSKEASVMRSSLALIGIGVALAAAALGPSSPAAAQPSDGALDPDRFVVFELFNRSESGG
jgi:hypothetical protein